eukprot:TRINITY_DN2055_c0_g2_i1.p1 TRINITY_DN2055_c0_g2~~TRINITY_DN2055_c0_g2_i1.p1  ORF type:complete len:140 (+),score=4.71 TRINITY_DN2055_c0_g2_i1:206-625(+)
MFVTRTGDVPIILTAPHGGEEWIAGVEKRSHGCIVLDSHTIQVMENVIDQMRNMGHNPYFIYTRITRKNCDFNRPAERAFENEEVRPFYEFYHNTITSYIHEIHARGLKCLLVDIHGHSAKGYLDTILRGTQNGKTFPM